MAFEPTPETFKELQNNFQINPGLSNCVYLYNMGISSSVGAIDFVDFGDMSGRNGIAYTSIHGRSESAKIIKIETNPLDCFSNEATGACMLKIDTEGHEVDVLRGGSEILSKNNCVVQIEDGHGKSELEIGTIFESYGYSKIFKIGPDSYYSNIATLQDPAAKLSLVEQSINFLIDHRWNKNPSL